MLADLRVDARELLADPVLLEPLELAVASRQRLLPLAPGALHVRVVRGVRGLGRFTPPERDVEPRLRHAWRARRLGDGGERGLASPLRVGDEAEPHLDERLRAGDAPGVVLDHLGQLGGVLRLEREELPLVLAERLPHVGRLRVERLAERAGLALEDLTRELAVVAGQEIRGLGDLLRVAASHLDDEEQRGRAHRNLAFEPDLDVAAHPGDRLVHVLRAGVEAGLANDPVATKRCDVAKEMQNLAVDAQIELPKGGRVVPQENSHGDHDYQNRDTGWQAHPPARRAKSPRRWVPSG